VAVPSGSRGWWVGRTPFVGRTRELRALLERLEAAGLGDGGVVLITGESGIGKTRLLRELATQAPHGWRVLAGRAYESEGLPPYLPFVEALRAFIRDCPADRMAERLGPATETLSLILPELRPRLAGFSPSPPSSRDDRYQLFVSVAEALHAIARKTGASSDARGLLLILDDLHWADAPSLLLLLHLAHSLADSPILVAGAYRSEGLRPDHQLHDLLAELYREGLATRFLLTALSPDECAAVIAQMSGAAPAAGVAERLQRTAEGNPFLLVELVRQLLGEGRDLADPDLAAAPWEIPDGVRQVIGRRLARLSSATRRLLECGSVLGERFDFSVIAAMAGSDSVAVADCIEEALATGIVREEGESYYFAHALIRRVQYDSLSLPRRRALHLEAAEAIERVHGRDLTPLVAALAAHYRLAGADAVAQALRWTRASADAALQVFAWEEAAAHWQAALDMLDSADQRGRCETLVALGDAQSRAGGHDRARESFQRAAALARTVGAHDLLVRAALGLPLAVRLEGDLLHGQVDLLEDALGTLHAGDDVLRARVLGGLAMALSNQSHWARADALAAEAVAMARRLGDRAELARALHAQVHTLWRPRGAEQRLRVADELLRLAGELGDNELVLLAHRQRLTAFVELGNLTEADREDAAYVRIAELLHQPLHRLLRLIRLVMRALLAGRFAEAEGLNEGSITLARRLGTPTWWMEWQAMTLMRERGRPEEAATIARAGLDRGGPRALLWECGLAAARCEAGQAVSLRSDFERLVETLRTPPPNVYWPVAAALLAQVCAALRDTDRAAILYDLLRPYAGMTISFNGQIACYGAADHFLGLLAATMARWDDAMRHFETALAMNISMAARPHIAHSEQDYAAALLRRGKRADATRARELLEQARVIFDDLGMARGAAAARALLEDPRTPSSPLAVVYPDRLSAREVEVLRMLAAGHSNREIAAILVVSDRTVAHHVEHIYRKIDARGRAEATAYALRRGLL